MSDKNNNIIVSLYPMTKFMFVICFSIGVLFLRDLTSLVVSFLLLNVIAILAKVYKEFILTVIKRLTIFFILIIIIQGLFYHGETILLRFLIFSVKLEGILYALKLSLLILNISSVLILFFQVTLIKNFVFALEQAGLSHKVSFIILSTLKMFSVLDTKSKIIMDSQRARGVETEGNILVRIKAFIPILIPLILTSISSTEEKALTLEARGFSAPSKHTFLYVLEKKKIDFILPKIFIILTILVILWRILWLLLK